MLVNINIAMKRGRIQIEVTFVSPNLITANLKKKPSNLLLLFYISATEVSVFFTDDQRSKVVRLTKHLKSLYQKRKNCYLGSSKD